MADQRGLMSLLQGNVPTTGYESLDQIYGVAPQTPPPVQEAPSDQMTLRRLALPDGSYVMVGSDMTDDEAMAVIEQERPHLLKTADDYDNERQTRKQEAAAPPQNRINNKHVAAKQAVDPKFNAGLPEKERQYPDPIQAALSAEFQSSFSKAPALAQTPKAQPPSIPTQEALNAELQPDLSKAPIPTKAAAYVQELARTPVEKPHEWYEKTGGLRALAGKFLEEGVSAPMHFGGTHLEAVNAENAGGLAKAALQSKWMGAVSEDTAEWARKKVQDYIGPELGEKTKKMAAPVLKKAEELRQQGKDIYRPTTDADIAAAAKEGRLEELAAQANQKFFEPVMGFGGSMGPVMAAKAVNPVLSGLALYSQLAGGLDRTAKDAGIPQDLMKSDGYALLQTAIYELAPGVLNRAGLDRLVGPSAAKIDNIFKTQGAEAAQAAAKTTAASIAKNVGATAISAGTAMAGSAAAERKFLGKDLWDDEAKEQYLESYKTSGVLASVLGPVQARGASRARAAEIKELARNKREADYLEMERQRAWEAQQAEEAARAYPNMRTGAEPPVPPAGEASVGEASVSEAPVGEASVSEAPVGEASVSEAPVGEAAPTPVPYWDTLGLSPKNNAYKALKDNLDISNPDHHAAIVTVLDDVLANPRTKVKNVDAITSLRNVLAPPEETANAEQITETSAADGSGGAQPSVLEEGGDQTISGEGVEPSRQGEQAPEISGEETQVPDEKVDAFIARVGEMQQAKKAPVESAPEVEASVEDPYQEVKKQAEMRKQQAAAMSVEDLTKLRDFAATENERLDLEAIEKHFGAEQAAKYAAMSRRQREKWWDTNATESLENDSSVVKGVDVDEVQDYIDAHSNAFGDTANELGYNVALYLTDSDKPSWINSPDYVAVREAFKLADKNGWDRAEVIQGMRARAERYAGADAPELFARLFKPDGAAKPKGGAQRTREVNAKVKTAVDAEGIPLTRAQVNEVLANTQKRNKYDLLEQVVDAANSDAIDGGTRVTDFITSLKEPVAPKAKRVKAVKPAAPVVPEPKAEEVEAAVEEAPAEEVEVEHPLVAEVDRLNQQLQTAGAKLRVIAKDKKAAQQAGDDAKVTRLTNQERTIEAAVMQLTAARKQMSAQIKADKDAEVEAKAEKARAEAAPKAKPAKVVEPTASEAEGEVEAAPAEPKKALPRHVQAWEDGRAEDHPSWDTLPADIKKDWQAHYRGSEGFVDADDVKDFAEIAKARAETERAGKEGEAAEEKPLFSRTAEKKKSPLPKTELTAHVKKITRLWRNAPAIIINKLEDLPKHIQDAIGDAESSGAYENGTIYLVEGRIHSEKGLQELLFHESYGHHGLRQMLGRALAGQLNNLFKKIGGDEGLRKYAKKYNFDMDEYDAATVDMHPYLRNAVMMEELLAHIAQEGPTFKAMARSIYGSIRQFLRHTGLAKLAEYNDADLSRIMRQARKTVIKGKTKAMEKGQMPMLSRKKRLSPAAEELAGGKLTQVEKPESLLKKTGATLKRVFELSTDREERHKVYSAARADLVASSEGLSSALKEYDKYIPGFGLRADYLRNQYDGLHHIARIGILEGFPVIEPKSKEIRIEPSDEFNLTKIMDDASQIPIDGVDANGEYHSALKLVGDVFRVKMAEQELQEYDRRAATAQSWRDNATNLKQAADAATNPREAARLRNKAADALKQAKKIEQEIKLQAKGEGRERLALDPALRLAANRLLAREPEVQDIMRRWKGLNKKLVQAWLDSGLIDADTARDWTTRWYIPMQMSNADLAANPEGRRFIGSGGAKAVARIAPKRGGKQAINVWENLYEHYLYMLAGAAKNNIRRQSFRQLEAIGAATRAGANTPGALRMKVDGKDVYFTVTSPDAFTALEMANESSSRLVNALADIGNQYRNTLVMQPGYWGKTLLRDPIEANFTTTMTTPVIKFITPLHSIYELGKIMMGLSKEQAELSRRGGTGYAGSLANPTRFSQALNSTGPVAETVDFVHKLHSAFDDATRVVLYKAALRQAKKDGITDPDEAKAYAAMEAREFANFQTKGRSKLIREYGRITPFFHAQIVSLDKFYRSLTGHNMSPRDAARQKAKFRSMALAMVGSTIAYTLVQMHDRRYRELPIKDWALNWVWGWDSKGVLDWDNGTHARKVVTPYETGFVFKFLPELAIRRALGLIDNEEAARAFKDTFMDTMFPPGIIDPVPIIARNLVELNTGVSLHSGMPIEDEREKNLRPEDRDKRASWLAKIASEAGMAKIGMSPNKFDVFMRNVFGEIYTQAAMTAEVMFDAAAGKGIPYDKDVTEYYPFIKSFIANPRKDSSVPRFYEMSKVISETLGSISKAEGEFDNERLKELYKDPEVLAHLKTKNAVEFYKENIQKLDKENRALKNVGMPEEKKRAIYDDNIAKRKQLAQDGIEAITRELVAARLKKANELDEMFLSKEEIEERRKRAPKTEHIESGGMP